MHGREQFHAVRRLVALDKCQDLNHTLTCLGVRFECAANFGSIGAEQPKWLSFGYRPAAVPKTRHVVTLQGRKDVSEVVSVRAVPPLDESQAKGLARLLKEVHELLDFNWGGRIPRHLAVGLHDG